MKSILVSVLVMLSLIGIASTQNSGAINTNHTEKEFTVEILNVSPEFKSGENGKIEISNVFMATKNDSSHEYFGSFWAEFEFVKKHYSNQYDINNLKVNDIRMAEDLSADEKEQIKAAFYKELDLFFDDLPKGSIEEILTNANKQIKPTLNTDAPPIIYSNLPAALIVIDGEPYYEVLDQRFLKVANAGAFIVKDTKTDLHFMYGGGLWFSSLEATSGWAYDSNVPNRVSRIMRKHARELYDSMKDEQYEQRIVPEIIVSTQPAELISTDGRPKFVQLPNTNLVYAENTDAELFRDTQTNRYYTLFSGRWFVADKVEGNWQYLAPENLPDGFVRIPENHEKSSVLASVPGTEAAKNAVKDAQIPHVKKNDISTVLDIQVSYDNDPEFVGIEGTSLMYAVNTSNAILQSGNTYYLVEDAVWYTSESPFGPWQIATQRPHGVEDIPADNPLYNIKYVYVYKNTDRVVYTGFTSGYTGSYVHGPTVVYGTGFHYHGWHGHSYYHHPMSYGYGFFYNPYYGWVPVYSPWYRPSFYWHWHWRYWYGYRPPYHRPPHHRPPSGVRPTHPIERPGRPDRPSTLPAEPGNRPATKPSTRPTQPNVRPTQPSTRPVQPSVRPTQPSTRPMQPSVRPAQPSFGPSRPAMRPSAPATRPGPARMR